MFSDRGIAMVVRVCTISLLVFVYFLLHLATLKHLFCLVPIFCWDIH